MKIFLCKNKYIEYYSNLVVEILNSRKHLQNQKFMESKLDEKDRELLNLLQSHAKWTNKQFATALGLSNTAVYERIKRLERQGIIMEYVALLDAKKIGRPFVVWCQVRLAQHMQQNVREFEKAIAELSEIRECYHVSGDYDYILRIQVKDLEAYRSFLVEKLTNIDGIGNTHSSFVIQEVKHSTAQLL